MRRWSRREQALLGFTHFDLGAEMISRWNCPPAVQNAARFCQQASVNLETPLALGAVVKSATLIADSQRISNFIPCPPDITCELLEALAIRVPVQFFAEFRAEYNDLQSCAA